MKDYYNVRFFKGKISISILFLNGNIFFYLVLIYLY